MTWSMLGIRLCSSERGRIYKATKVSWDRLCGKCSSEVWILLLWAGHVFLCTLYKAMKDALCRRQMIRHKQGHYHEKAIMMVSLSTHELPANAHI